MKLQNYFNKTSLLFVITLSVMGGILFASPQSAFAAPSDDFVTTWKTDNAGTSNSTSITIPTTGGGYLYDVDWDNDNIFDEFGLTGNVTHDFGVAGTYTIRIQGTFPRIYFNNGGDRRKILSVDQWGTIAWAVMEQAFYGCTNLTIPATDTPDLSLVTDMDFMFAGATAFNQDISSWNVSSVLDMEGMFLNADAFNQDISSWNVSSVLDMQSMFYGANVFNQDISSWNVSSVTNMGWMFFNTASFNQPLNLWNVSSVTNMENMFEDADAFNQAIGDWDVSSVTDMSSMFSYATVFNQAIGDWDVSSVTDMYNMFNNATAFNQGIGLWDVSSVTNMEYMFLNADAFNQDISSWNVSSVTDIYSMFTNADAFNQDISSWDVSNVANMQYMFYGATAFNQAIGDWDVSSVTDITSMFEGITLSTINYQAILDGWSAQTVQTGLSFHGGNSKYCDEAPRDILIGTYSWTITDGGQDSCPTVESVTPTDGATGVAVDTQIVITFSEAMDPGSEVITSGPCDDSCPSYDAVWSDGDTVLTLTSIEDFDQETTYIISITANDVGGAPLEGDYEWSFTTARTSSSSGSSTVASRALAQKIFTNKSLETPALCPADQIITQNLRAPSRNGVYNSYTRGIVKEAKILQAHLNRLGFNSGPEDGILGPISIGAIKRMQTFLKTTPDGYVGPITRGLLNNSCGSRGLSN